MKDDSLTNSTDLKIDMKICVIAFTEDELETIKLSLDIAQEKTARASRFIVQINKLIGNFKCDFAPKDPDQLIRLFQKIGKLQNAIQLQVQRQKNQDFTKSDYEEIQEIKDGGKKYVREKFISGSPA